MNAENPPSAITHSGFGAWLAVGAVFLFGIFVRAFRIGEQLILDDEWHALNAVQDHGYTWIFSHLGHADHSIPLTLLYEFFSHTIGLSEITMRAPSLLAGVLMLVMLPLLMRPWLQRGECMTMAALIAISPFLINYSRIARPYALLGLLAGASIPLAWRWWQTRHRGAGFAWFACTVLGAWLNPVSLALTAGPFLWFGGGAVAAWRRQRHHRPLLRLAAMATAMAAGITALMFAPMSNDFASLAVKSGVHQVDAQTFIVGLSLFTGSGYPIVVAAMVIAAMIGWAGLYRRDPSFSMYLLMIAAAATLAITLTGAEWIMQGLVLARYLLGLLPLYLALAAIGLVLVSRTLARVFKLRSGTGGVFITAALLALLMTGPLPGIHAGGRQFDHHMSRQFDYNPRRNPFHAVLEPVIPEPFYEEIAQLHPAGDALVVEAPWHLESNWNALPLYQHVHGQRVMVGFIGGVCAGRLYGELRQDIEGMAFRNFTSVQDVLDGRVKADFLVLRSRAIAGARTIAMNFEECERAVRSVLGNPWRSTPSALLFRVSHKP